MKKTSTFALLVSTCCIVCSINWSQAAVHRPDIQAPGHEPQPLKNHTFTHATIVISPSLTMTNATLVIAGGNVVSVSEGGELPEGSRVWNMKGHTIYPGFIDPYTATFR